jgi:N-acetylglucosamine-6-phosphate deacetylase
VTDAMPTVGWDRTEFMLGGRRIIADGERCVAEDGTLAGSNLDMAKAVRNAQGLMGVELETAVRMASSVPASVLGLSEERGVIRVGTRADLVLMDGDGNVVETWVGD